MTVYIGHLPGAILLIESFYPVSGGRNRGIVPRGYSGIGLRSSLNLLALSTEVKLDP